LTSPKTHTVQHTKCETVSSTSYLNGNKTIIC